MPPSNCFSWESEDHCTIESLFSWRFLQNMMKLVLDFLLISRKFPWVSHCRACIPNPYSHLWGSFLSLLQITSSLPEMWAAGLHTAFLQLGNMSYRSNMTWWHYTSLDCTQIYTQYLRIPLLGRHMQKLIWQSHTSELWYYSYVGQLHHVHNQHLRT